MQIGHRTEKKGIRFTKKFFLKSVKFIDILLKKAELWYNEASKNQSQIQLLEVT